MSKLSILCIEEEVTDAIDYNILIDTFGVMQSKHIITIFKLISLLRLLRSHLLQIKLI